MNFAKSAALTFITNLLGFFISILATIIVSRILGPAGKGVVGVANNFLSFATLILGLGMAASNVFFLGKRRDNLDEVIGNNLVTALAGFILLIPFYFINNIYHFAFLKGVDNMILLVVLFTVPLINLKSAILNVLLGLQEILEYNRLNMIDRIVSLAILVALIFPFNSPASVVVATLIGTIVIALLEFYILIKRMGHKIKFNLGLLQNMLGYGIKAQIGNIIQFLNYRLDVFIINYFLPLSQVGIYTIAVALGETLWQVSGSISTIMFPIAASATDKKELKLFTNQVTRISFTLIMGFSVGLALVSKPLIILWFGQSFAEATGALLWLLPGICIFSVSNILANYLAGVGLVSRNIISSIVSCIVTVVLDFVLIPKIGINGASIATSISYIAFTIMTIIFYIQYTKSRWQDILLLKRMDIALIRTAIKRKIGH